ncbi:MAG TPA: L-glutamate gamma-semialdehyde dehydrogenase [Bacteroidetes bacterium]|nr:L-glutamate gamma-semialdehyde dehydrogenase [Bacteroidota bacterium]
MSNAIFKVPIPTNEPVLSYAPGSAERIELQAEVDLLLAQQLDIPMFIGGEEIRTSDKRSMSPPHDHQHILGHFSRGDATHVNAAIHAALQARDKWAATPWQDRAAVFLKAADLLVGPYRARMNAATMLAQSKNANQAEIDAVCELADFWRFNVAYMTQIYQEQPDYSPEGIWNRLEYRALEGFVFAITPFNFTSIAANLPGAPAMMGNTVVWKPADTQIYSAQVIMDIYREAGLPAGVINLIFVDGPTAGDIVFKHPQFAGLHFTGSTGVFQHIWKEIGINIAKYRSYPRIVGETGGKDFIFAHPSANPGQVATAISRGTFEFQGQKCSAASRVYLPKSIYVETMQQVLADLKSFKMGDPRDFTNFINAVIDERAFDKITSYIDQAKADSEAEIIAGGNYDKSKGYFIEPTIIKTTNPRYLTMCEEIFGPVLTVFEYADDQWEETVELVDDSSPYALTGAIFAKDRYVINQLADMLVNAAGNFYINDKPTGAVVGQQPFGGARASGTNDKAGSYLNLLRWVSARTIKESFVAPTDYRYPFLQPDA